MEENAVRTKTSARERAPDERKNGIAPPKTKNYRAWGDVLAVTYVTAKGTKVLAECRQCRGKELPHDEPSDYDCDGCRALHLAGAGVSDANQDDAPDSDYIEGRSHRADELARGIRIEVVRKIRPDGIVDVEALRVYSRI